MDAGNKSIDEIPLIRDNSFMSASHLLIAFVLVTVCPATVYAETETSIEDLKTREEGIMATAYDTLAGKSLEWTGTHHSEHGDFTDISTHTVSYETETTCYVTAGGKLVGEANYTYRKLDDQMAIVIYRPDRYQGRSDVVLYAMLDFERMTDQAIILADGEPFAVADGSIREVATPPRP